MTIVLAALAALYLAGVYLVVSSLVHKREWVEDENGQLHYAPRAR